MKKSLSATLFVGAFVIAACLPGDLRPEPGHVYVSVESSDAAVNGFVTEDGWTIHFERLLVGMGYTMLGGDDCEVYGEAQYTELFDFTVPGKQMLGEVYGLNACNLEFHVNPAYFAYLGNGVTVADRAMIVDRNDLLANGFRAPSIYVRGNAIQGSVTKHFAWKFRGGYSFNECENPMDGTINTSLQLQGSEELQPIVTFHPDELFRDNIETDAAVRFDPLAAADTNSDGELSLEEVSQIPAPVVELTPKETLDAGALDGGYIVDDMSKLPGWPRFMTQKLLARAFRLDGHVCRQNYDLLKRGNSKYPYDL
jgi:hypothetical protein